MENVKISIIGGGLSAIYSYFGCMKAGFKPEEVEVLHNGFSRIPGAVFMYDCPIPWASHDVVNVLLGDCDTYALKQWGNAKIRTSAHTRFEEGSQPKIIEHLYDPEELVITLWGMIPNLKETGILSKEDVSKLKGERIAVIATYSDKYVRERYVQEGFLDVFPVYKNSNRLTIYTVIYNGLLEVPWIRQTIMPGRTYIEYPRGYSVNDITTYERGRDNPDGSISLVPDLSPNCVPLTREERCEDNLLRVGRFAVYDPKYLSHYAMLDTYGFLENMK